MLSCRRRVVVDPAKRRMPPTIFSQDVPSSTGVVRSRRLDLSPRRACSRSRTWSGVYARRLRSARTMTTPVAATPAVPARPNIFHQRMRLG
jgi:hypothetical protein